VSFIIGPATGWFRGIFEQAWSCVVAIGIVEVKSFKLSTDNKEVVVAGRGRYVGDFEIAIDVACLDGFIDVLTAAKNALGPVTSSRDRNAASGLQNDSAATAAPGAVKFAVPKNCTVTADMRAGLALLVLNHRLDNQQGYAFPPEGAAKVANLLAQVSDRLLAERQTVPASHNGSDAKASEP
jgi:hypothetical protein